VSQNYLTGSNGKFDPNGELTGYAFGKMLLNVLGYGLSEKTVNGNTTTVNKYEGTQWAINVAVDGNAIKLFKNVDSSLNGAITRVDAMNMVFNALEQAYELRAAAAKAEPAVAVTKDQPFYALADDFAYDKDTDDADVFGRPITTYTIGEDDDELATGVATPVATFNTAVTEDDIFTAVGADGFTGAARFIVMKEIYIDGVLEGKSTTTDKDAVAAVVNGVSSKGAAEATVLVTKGTKDAAAAGTGNGTTVEIYATDVDNVYTMVCINEYIGTVSAVEKANANTGVKRSVTIAGIAGYETEDFAVDDVVLYTKAGSSAKVQSAKLATTVSGTVTKSTSAGVYTIGGTTYKISEKVNDSLTSAVGTSLSTSLSSQTAGEWYVDSLNNIIAVKAADTTVDWQYGYLVGYAYSLYKEAGLLGTGASAAAEKLQIITSDGKLTTFDGVFTTNAKTGAVTAWVLEANTDFTNGNFTLAANALVRYTLDSNGKVNKIQTISESSSEGVSETKTGTTALTATKGAAKLDNNKYVNDKTVFIAFKSTTDFVVYVGYNNIPAELKSTGDASTVDWEYFYQIKNGTKDETTVAAVVLNVAKTSVTSSSNYVYFASASKYSETTESGAVTTYDNVYLNGVKGEIKFATDPSTYALAGYLYEYVTDSATGLATLVDTEGDEVDSTDDAVGVKASATEVTVSESGYFVAGSVVYVGDSTKYYAVDDTTGEITTATSLPALSANYTVKVIFADKDTTSTSPAKTVYYTVVYAG
jgi:hypothetical protein